VTAHKKNMPTIAALNSTTSQQSIYYLGTGKPIVPNKPYVPLTFGYPNICRLTNRPLKCRQMTKQQSPVPIHNNVPRLPQGIPCKVFGNSPFHITRDGAGRV